MIRMDAMCRLIGSLFLIAGTTGIGLCCCAQMRRRMLVLRKMQRLFGLIYSQVSYRRESLPEICRVVSSQTDGDFRQMLTEMYEVWLEHPGTPFPQIWKECSVRYSAGWGLKREEQAMLESFGGQSGHADREFQEHSMEGIIDELSKYMEMCGKKKDERERMIMSFGIMGGLLSVIILI